MWFIQVQGVINNNYELYTPLMDKMKELNLQMYSLADFFDKKKKQLTFKNIPEKLANLIPE